MPNTFSGELKHGPIALIDENMPVVVIATRKGNYHKVVSYVVGNDPLKIKLSKDIEDAWHKGKAFYDSHKEITGAQLYYYCQNLANDCVYLVNFSI